jgi:hypothetical protein
LLEPLLGKVKIKYIKGKKKKEKEKKEAYIKGS